MNNEYYIEEKDWNKIINYSQAAHDKWKSEIGGMSVVIQDDDGDWFIKDPVILKQTVSGGNTVLEKEALAPYYTQMAKKYKNKNFRFCWWHSHHTMEAFWSGTDLTAIDEFEGGDMSFALVVNLKEECLFRVSIWKPTVIHQDVELNILKKQRKVPAKITTEVEAMCDTIKRDTKSYGSLFNRPSYFKKTYNKTDKVIDLTVFDDEPTPPAYDYSEAYNLIGELQDKTSDGTLTQYQYEKAINNFNNKAIENDSGTIIELLEWEQWKSVVLTTTPANFITDSDMLGYDYHARWGI